MTLAWLVIWGIAATWAQYAKPWADFSTAIGPLAIASVLVCGHFLNMALFPRARQEAEYVTRRVIFEEVVHHAKR